VYCAMSPSQALYQFPDYRCTVRRVNDFLEYVRDTGPPRVEGGSRSPCQLLANLECLPSRLYPYIDGRKVGRILVTERNADEMQPYTLVQEGIWRVLSPFDPVLVDQSLWVSKNNEYCSFLERGFPPDLEMMHLSQPVPWNWRLYPNSNMEKISAVIRKCDLKKVTFSKMVEKLNFIPQWYDSQQEFEKSGDYLVRTGKTHFLSFLSLDRDILEHALRSRDSERMRSFLLEYT